MKYYNLFIINMQVFKLTDMQTLWKKSRLLTGYYELLLKNLSPDEPDTDQQPRAKKNKPAGRRATGNIASKLLSTSTSYLAFQKLNAVRLLCTCCELTNSMKINITISCIGIVSLQLFVLIRVSVIMHEHAVSQGDECYTFQLTIVNIILFGSIDIDGTVLELYTDHFYLV